MCLWKRFDGVNVIYIWHVSVAYRWTVMLSMQISQSRKKYGIHQIDQTISNKVNQLFGSGLDYNQKQLWTVLR